MLLQTLPSSLRTDYFRDEVDLQPSPFHTSNVQIKKLRLEDHKKAVMEGRDDGIEESLWDEEELVLWLSKWKNYHLIK